MKAKSKVRRGRPPLTFSQKDKHIAQGMVLHGVPFEQIAKMLCVSPDALRKHLGPTLHEAKLQASARVASNLYRMATGTGREALTAAIFYLKTQAGWVERSHLELSGNVDIGARLIAARRRLAEIDAK